ncbi:hypothetical protein CGRA01v4_02901 [Colletotrichum graminicola]|nr:hypothetical protein CGRA01v4_02901 [Colletotrichum graminicola]
MEDEFQESADAGGVCLGFMWIFIVAVFSVVFGVVRAPQLPPCWVWFCIADEPMAWQGPPLGFTSFLFKDEVQPPIDNNRYVGLGISTYPSPGLKRLFGQLQTLHGSAHFEGRYSRHMWQQQQGPPAMHTKIHENGTEATRLMVRVANPFVPSVTQQQEGIDNDESLALQPRRLEFAPQPLAASLRLALAQKKTGMNGSCKSGIVWRPLVCSRPPARNTPLCTTLQGDCASLQRYFERVTKVRVQGGPRMLLH